MYLAQHVACFSRGFTRNFSSASTLAYQKVLVERERVKKPMPNRNKPQPTDIGISKLTRRLSWLLRHAAQAQGIRIRPDGYVRVSDLLRYYLFKRQNPNSLRGMLLQDPQHRFEFKEEEGQWPGSKELLVRHQGGHTIKGIQTSAKRITSSSKIPVAIFCTDVERWKTFSEHGLWSERGDELIHLVPKIPEYEGVEASTSSARILISIDVEKAMRSGDIMFYKINDGSVITEGDQRGCIPPEYFKEVIAVTWDNEVLLDRTNNSAT